MATKPFRNLSMFNKHHVFTYSRWWFSIAMPGLPEGISSPSVTIVKSMDDSSQYMESHKTCSKPSSSFSMFNKHHVPSGNLLHSYLKMAHRNVSLHQVYQILFTSYIGITISTYIHIYIYTRFTSLTVSIARNQGGPPKPESTELSNDWRPVDLGMVVTETVTTVTTVTLG